MPNKDNTKIFVDEIYSKPPKRNYPTIKLVHKHIDEIWSIDLADFSDYKISNKKGLRYKFIIFDNFSKYLWALCLKHKYGQTITNEFSNTLTTSKRRPLKLEGDRGAELYNSVFQNFLKVITVRQYSRFTDKGLTTKAERVIRTIRNLIKKPMFLAGNDKWLIELPSVIKQFNNKTHHGIKMAPFQASKKVNEKIVYNNLKDNREIPKPKFKLGQLLRTADI